MRDSLGSRLAVLLEKLEETANRVVDEIDHSQHENKQSQQATIEAERNNP